MPTLVLSALMLGTLTSAGLAEQPITRTDVQMDSVTADDHGNLAALTSPLPVVGAMLATKGLKLSGTDPTAGSTRGRTRR